MPTAPEDDSSGNGSPVFAEPSTPPTAPATTAGARPGPASGTNGGLRHAPKRVPELRQVRGTVRHIDLWSVFRVSALIYGSFFLVVLVAGFALWVVASATGARHSVEHFIASALLLKQFRFASLTILVAATGIGVVLSAAATGATIAVAGFYNLVSEVVGGVELTIVQEEPAGTVV